MAYQTIPDWLYKGLPVWTQVPDPLPVLRPSGPIVMTAGQVVENLLITADGAVDGISGRNATSAIVRNCRVVLLGNASKDAVSFTDSPGIKIDGLDIVKSDAPVSGTLPSEQNGVQLARCDVSVVTRLRTRHVTKGLSIYQSKGVNASQLEFLNPRTGGGVYGMGFQGNASTGCGFMDFSVLVDLARDVTGDTCNLFNCDKMTVLRGLIDGNTFLAGDCLMIQNAPGTGGGHIVQDVDALNGCNGGFGVYPSSQVTFTRARVKDMHSLTPGGLKPSSGGLAFTAGPGSSAIAFVNCQYWNLGTAGVDWNEANMTVKEFLKEDFVPRAPITLTGSPFN